MDKIKALMVKCGLSEDAAAEITTAINQHITTHNEAVKKESDEKVGKIKQLCLEETEAYKRELARRLQICLEAKSAMIEQQITKQAAGRDTTATLKLEQINSLVNGFEPADTAKSQEFKTRLENLEKTIKVTKEERDVAIKRANRQNELCEKVLKRNRDLERKQLELEAANPGKTTLGEGRNTPPRPAGAQRLDTGRRGGRPVTQRPTIRENQDQKPPVDNRQSNTRPGTTAAAAGAGATPASIAAQMED